LRGLSLIFEPGEMLDFARQLADRFAVMERGAIVMSGESAALRGEDVRQRLAI
jgi:urea transport system ATP-binding protein